MVGIQKIQKGDTVKMDTKIYYMTGTGNSLAIAKDICKLFNKCEIISIPKIYKKDEKINITGEIVGFVFPVYFARPPAFMKDFLENVNFENVSYIFAIANGGGLFGRTLHIFNKLINEKGEKLDSGFIIGMPGNHPKIGTIFKKSKEEYYVKKDEKIKKISNIIKSKSQNKIESNLGLLGHFFSYFAFKKIYKKSAKRKLDYAFWVNDSCVKCGCCERICPIKNITNSKIKPKWNGNCINCCACYHNCKAKAICLENEDPNFRYLHPDISRN